MKPILIFLLTSVAALSNKPEIKTEPTITPIEQEIIETTISQSFETSTSKRHVILDTTTIRPLQMSRSYDEFSNSLRNQARSHDAAFQEALEDFLRKNRTETTLCFPKPLGKNTQLITGEELSNTFAGGSNKKPSGWDVFYTRFPRAGGIITISRPGIDSKRSIAILYFGQQSHYLLGSGQLYIFKHDGKKWTISVESFGPSWVY